MYAVMLITKSSTKPNNFSYSKFITWTKHKKFHPNTLLWNPYISLNAH